MTRLRRAKEAIIADLHRQAERSGCYTADNGKLVQVDGSFDAEAVARAVLAALGQPTA